MDEKKEKEKSKTIEPQKHELPLGYESWSEKEKVNYLTEYVLVMLNSDINTRFPAALISAEAGKHFVDHGINEKTFRQYISVLSGSSSNRIGKKAGQTGYYILSDTSFQIGKDDKVLDEEKAVQREKYLYPIFAEWLLGNCDRVKDTSDKRGSNLGTWGNPDITGIMIREVLGEIEDIEIITLEIKITIDDWRYNIFESIAHKRFSNRSYFCFSHPEELIPKIDDDLRYYAEIFGVGILILPLKEDHYNELKTTKNKLKEDYFQVYSASDIIEYYSADFDKTHLHFRDRFLKALKINTKQELTLWGK